MQKTFTIKATGFHADSVYVLWICVDQRTSFLMSTNFIDLGIKEPSWGLSVLICSNKNNAVERHVLLSARHIIGHQSVDVN